MVRLSKALPRDVFVFLEELSHLGPCSLEQVRSSLKAKIQVVRSARAFSTEYQLATLAGEEIRLTSLGERLMRYTGEKRVEFTIRHWRLQEMEPFRFLKERLGANLSPISTVEAADLVRARFTPKERWDSAARKSYGEAFVAWLEYMHLVKRMGEKVEYAAGEVLTPSVFSLLDMEFLKERELRDWYAEEFPKLDSILEEPASLLNKIPGEAEDKVRSDLYESFIESVGKRLGFTHRKRNAYFKEPSGLTFEDNKGGGDIVLFFHFPLEARSRTYEGAALACEVKSTEGNVGSKAVGQARNLVTRVKSAFPKYYVVPAVISRSKVGYDPSGRDQAPPEVVHLTDQMLVRLLSVQKTQVATADRLIIPPIIFEVLDGLVRDENLEPQPDDLENRVRAVLSNKKA